MARGRGGHRRPTNPAPVSPPGSGARTDGGPGHRASWNVPSGQPYGARQHLEAVQAVAPPATAPATSPPGGMGPGRGLAPVSPFGPSQRPNEPGDFGVTAPEDQLDAQTLLRIIYSKRPSPYIARLINGFN